MPLAPRRGGGDNRDRRGGGRGRDHDDRHDRNDNRRQGIQRRGGGGGGGHRFHYQRRSEEDVRAQQERSRSSIDLPVKKGTQLFRPENGENVVRILPPTWPEAKHYAYQVWLHRYVGSENGTYVCLRKMKGQRCACCEAERDERERGDLDLAKEFAAREHWFCYVLDRNGKEPEKPQVWMMSNTQDEEIVRPTRNRRTGAVLYVDDPDEGYDLSFMRRQLSKEAKNVKYTGWTFDRDPSPLHDDPEVQSEVLRYIEENPIPEILYFRDNDYLEQVMSGTGGDSDAELDEQDAGDYGDEGDQADSGDRTRRAPSRRASSRDDQGQGDEQDQGSEDQSGDDQGYDDDAGDHDQPADEGDIEAAAEEDAGDEATGEGEPSDEGGEEPDVGDRPQGRRPLRTRGNGRDRGGHSDREDRQPRRAAPGGRGGRSGRGAPPPRGRSGGGSGRRYRD